MVQTSKGDELAWISILSHDYQVIYESFVKPESEVVDFRTKITGIDQQTFEKQSYKTFQEVINDLKRILGEDTIIIGHSLENDFRCLKIIHQKCLDTSILFLQKNSKISLKYLAYQYFRIVIQEQEHDPRTDAKISLGLARLKIEILDKLGGLEIQRSLVQNVDLLGLLNEKYKVLVLDENLDCLKKLMKSGIYYEEVKSEFEVFEKMKKFVKKREREAGFCGVIMGKVQFKEENQNIFVKEIEELCKLCQSMVGKLLCVTTMSCLEEKEGGIGYDGLLMV